MNRSPSRFRSLIFFQAAVLIAAGWFAFSPAFHGEFLWDDDSEITANQAVQDSKEGLWKIWLIPTAPEYFNLPLKATLQWGEWRLWGNRVFGYHVASAAAHLLSAFLLWRLLLRLGVPWPWFGALLFVVHPLMVESVAWIAEQKNTFSLPPLLLAMLAWLDYDEKQRSSAYGLALFWFFAAMLCKSSVVMFPAVLLLYAWWKRGSVSKKECFDMAPFWALAVMMGLIAARIQEACGIGTEDLAAGSLFSRFLGAGAAVFFYLAKFLVPVGLVPVYPHRFYPFSWLPLLSWPLLALLGVWFWRRRESWGRHALLAGGFFLINLFPVSGLVPMAYLEFTQVADHFVYIPLIGCIGAAAAAAGWAFGRLAPVWRPYFLGAVGVVFVLLAWQSHRDAALFERSSNLWSYTLSKNPNLWIAHCNLGNALIEEGRYEEAVGQLLQAFDLKPGNLTVCNNLGIALIESGHSEEAIEPLRQAVKIDPAFAKAHYNLARAYSQTGRIPEAVEEYRKVLELEPSAREVRRNLQDLLKSQETKGR